MVKMIKVSKTNVKLTCRLLGLPESSYYEYRKRSPSKQQLRRQFLSEQIQKLYTDYQGIYGAPKIHHELTKLHIAGSLKLVQTIMQELKLQAIVVKKYKPVYATSDQISRSHLVSDEPTAQNQVWSTDITYIPTKMGWTYLSVIMDRYTKQIIAWDLGKNMTVDLVQSTLNKAIQSQGVSQSLILHSDQGSQYTSQAYEQLLTNYGISHSFSRKGYPYHNASLESWHAHLKQEWTNRFHYQNWQAAYQSIFWYIEAFYNDKRIHQSLDYLSPNRFAQMIA